MALNPRQVAAGIKLKLRFDSGGGSNSNAKTVGIPLLSRVECLTDK